MNQKKWLTVKEFAEKIEKSIQYTRRMISKGKIEKRSIKKVRNRLRINYELAIIDMENNLSSRMPSIETQEEPEVENTQTTKKLTKKLAPWEFPP